MKPRFITPLPLYILGALLAMPLAVWSAPAASEQPVTVTTSANTEQDAAILARYQLALDQLTTGATGTARVILEDSVHRYGPRPEINLLLAYVLQREGNNNSALETINQVAKESALASVFGTQLRERPPIEVAPAVITGTLNTLPTVTIVAAPKNNSSLSQNDARLSKLEVAMMDMVNAERTKANLGTLQWNSDLADVARAHAAEMRDKNYFSHESPTPGLVTHLDRYRAAGHDSPRVIAENIFRAWGSPKQVSLNDIQSGHEALMQSPGHRANILYRDVTQIGIGIAANTKGDVWITQMFLRP